METFSYRSARSTHFVVGISVVLAIETIALHLLLVRNHPVVAWLLTAMNVSAALWLVGDYRALGTRSVRIADDVLHLTIGRRFDITIPRQRIAHVLRPTFRDLPAPGSTLGHDFLNLTKPAQPNVLIVLTEPTDIPLRGGLQKRLSRIALHLDEPDAFVARLQAH